MPPKKGFNKKTAQKFALVYRSTEDPLYNDDEAPKQVLVPVEDLNSRENKQERKNRYKKPILFGEEDAQKFKESGGRDNEGEAALYGIYFDDSKYDYMQHLKPIGTTPDAVFVSKRDREKKEKNVGLLLNPEYAARNNISLPKEVLPSEHTVKRTYQDQQNIPDAIAGFQPDMDPALREVLEALDDDEYNVDEDEQDDDLFNELLKSGEADSEDDAYYDDDYDDDYDQEYDDYSDNDSVAGAKDSSIMQRIPDMGSSIPVNGSTYTDSGIPDLDSGIPDIESAVPVSANGANEQDWEKAFRDFKISQSTSKHQAGFDSDHSEAEDEVGSLSAVTAVTRKNQSKKKKKKNFGGPGTEMTGLSMSSSANYRNEGLTLLDDRFDTIEEEYLDDTVEDNYETFDIKKERADLESILDDFLDNYAIDGKKLVRNDDENKAREHYVTVEKSKLRDDSIVVDGKRYKGSKTSRKDLYADSEEEESEDDSEEIDDKNDFDKEEFDDEESVDNDEEMNSDNDNEGEAVIDENLEAQEEVSETKRNKLQAILDTEKKVLASQLSTIAHTDAEKGAAIQQQMSVYESILDTRIKLQKGLAAANTFPLTSESLEKINTDESDAKIEKLKKSLYKLLDELTSIRVNMMEADGIKIDSIKISKKRTFENAIDNATQLENKLTPYRDAVLTKWSRKVQAASGASALNQSKFSIQNQNAQLQVSTNLADMDRLVKRTRINRSNYVVLGEEKENADKEKDSEEKANYKKNKVDANLQERTEIFDDTDFYRILLKDLVDRRMADAGTSEGVKWTVVKPKVKKVVDTKASKGRKLRYHVQEKILNFDAPRQFVQWNDDQIDELFAGLFGQKIEVDEIEDDKKEEQEEEEVESDKFEGFQLFG